MPKSRRRVSASRTGIVHAGNVAKTASTCLSRSVSASEDTIWAILCAIALNLPPASRSPSGLLRSSSSSSCAIFQRFIFAKCASRIIASGCPATREST